MTLGSQDSNRRHAAIVGAGIGGLAAGIALRDAGWSVTVFERDSQLRPLGAGLSVWPNGVRALRSLGLGSIADEGDVPRVSGALRRSDGTALADFDPQVIEERFGAPLVGIHRADLLNGLRDALGDEHLRLGRGATGVEDGTLRFADGETEDYDLVVGADGLGSVVRSALLGAEEPRDSGIVAFRGVAAVGADSLAGEWWAKGSAAGVLPLRGGRTYWYVAFHGEPDLAELETHLTAYAQPLRDVVEATDQGDVLVHRLYDRPPVKQWGAGRATLLGDAAHPMLPFLGQGACSALEDAVALGAALSGEEDVPESLRRYEAERAERTAALVRGSRQAARMALLRSPAGSAVRNFLLRRAPASARLRQLDKIVGRG